MDKTQEKLEKYLSERLNKAIEEKQKIEMNLTSKDKVDIQTNSFTNVFEIEFLRHLINDFENEGILPK